MTDYTDIIRRLTEAAGPDRTLDWEVHVFHGLEGVGMYGAHPEYTASLDASIALCEMMLPGCAREQTRYAPDTTMKRSVVAVAHGGLIFPASHDIEPMDNTDLEASYIEAACAALEA